MAGPVLTVPLNDGADMPALGVVSFRRDSIKDLKDSLTTCIEKGLRSFEISELYGNGDAVVSHVLAHDIPREELYFTVKV